MKKASVVLLFTALFGLCAFARADALPPAAAKVFDAQKWDGYSIAAISGYEGNESFAAQYALVMKKDDHNVLCIVEKDPGTQAYQLTVETDQAIHQGERLPSLLIDSGGDSLFYTYRYESGDLLAEAFGTVKLDDAWYIPTLMLFYAEDEDGLYPEAQAWFDGNALRYSFVWCDEAGNVVKHGEPQSIPGVPLGKYLHSFSIDSIPHDPSAVREYFAIPENQAATGNMDGYLDRVKLRAKPSTDGRILGQYFSDVPVDLFGNQGKWSYVGIGREKGYMMTEFLSFHADANSDGVPGYIRFPEAEGRLPLYMSPDAASAELARMPAGYVQVLGMVGEKWLHILYTDYENGHRRMIGYASSDAISNTDNFATVVVDTGDPAIKQNLRAAPSRDAQIVAQIFSGTVMYWMFDDHTNGDGWERVRVADALGYMRTEDLDFSSGFEHRYVPPLSCAVHDAVPLYDTATGIQVSESLSSDTMLSVLGIQGDRYIVRIETDDPSVFSYRYADKDSIRPVKESVAAEGIQSSE